MAERTRLSDVRVGAFVLTALAILIAGSLWVAGSGIFGTGRTPYTVRLGDSAGLQAGDRVRVAGVAAGRIQAVSLRPGDEWPVVMEVQLRDEVALHEDASAVITSAGLLGTPYLQIDPGTPAAGRLAPGGTIRGGPAPGMNEALAQLGELSVQAQDLLAQVSELLGDVGGQVGPVLAGLERVLAEENTDNLGELLASLNRTLDESGPRLASLLERMESLTARAEEGLEDLPELTERMNGLVTDVRAAFGPEGERLARVLDSAGRSLDAADEALAGLAGSREELEWTLRDLRDAVRNLKAFSRTVKERPFSLVRVKMPKDRKPGDGVAK